MAKSSKITALLEQLLVALKSEESEAKPKKSKKKEAPPPAKKRGRPPKVKPLAEDEPYEQPEIEDAVPLESLQKPKKVKKTKEQILANLTAEDKIRERTGRAKKGSQARRVQLTVPKGGRPNIFEKSIDFNAHKDDVRIDKLLNKGRTPTPRIGTPRTKVEVDCFVCHDTYEVHPGEISSEGRYRCQDCIGKEPSGGGFDEDDYEVLEDDS